MNKRSTVYRIWQGADEVRVVLIDSHFVIFVTYHDDPFAPQYAIAIRHTLESAARVARAALAHERSWRDYTSADIEWILSTPAGDL